MVPSTLLSGKFQNFFLECSAMPMHLQFGKSRLGFAKTGNPSSPELQIQVLLLGLASSYLLVQTNGLLIQLVSALLLLSTKIRQCEASGGGGTGGYHHLGVSTQNIVLLWDIPLYIFCKHVYSSDRL